MPTHEEIEEAKGNIRDSVARLRSASPEQLYAALVQELIPEAKLKTPSTPRDVANPEIFVIPIALVFLLSAVIFPILRIKGWTFADTLDDLICFTAKDRIVLLGFVVALASYVATVGRDLVKQLPGKEDNKRKKETKLSIFLLVQVEVSLVLLGVSTIITLFFGDWLKDKTVYFIPDVFLVVYLALILLWMSGLHVRVWRITGAWYLYK